MTNPRTSYHSTHKEEVKRIDHNEIISKLEKIFNLDSEKDSKTFSYTIKNMIKNERMLHHVATDVFHMKNSEDFIKVLINVMPELFNFHLVNFIKNKNKNIKNARGKTKLPK